MSLSRQLAKGTCACTINRVAFGSANSEIHSHTATTDLNYLVVDYDLTRFAQGHAESYVETVNDHINILVAINIEVGHAEQMLEKFLLCTL